MTFSSLLQANHSALDGEYTAITVEMKAISQFFGKEYLKDVSMDDIMANLPALREKAGDRAVLRAIHFITETERVRKLAAEVKEHDYTNFEKAVTDSGLSSWRFYKTVQHQTLNIKVLHSSSL